MSTPRRHRSSTAASSPLPHSGFVAALIEDLEQLDAIVKSDTESPNIPVLLLKLQQLRKCLELPPPAAKTKDAFRHHHGFSTLLDVLRTTSGYYHSGRRTEPEKETIFRLLGSVLSVLSEVFKGHYGNRKYFKHRVEGGGWAALEQAIASIGFGGSDSDSWTENKLFGLLMAFAVDDERLRPIFEVLHDQISAERKSNAKSNSTHGMKVLEATANEETYVLEFIRTRLYNLLTDNTLLPNAEILPSIIAFWKTLPRGRSLTKAPTALLVVEFLRRVSYVSQSNLLALHSQGALSSLLPLAYEDDSPITPIEKQSVEALCDLLMSMGLSELDDARYLVRSKSTKAADFLLRMSKISHHPPHIQFDLSLNGYSCLELNLGRSFPPQASPGYTFTAWIYIDQFDSNAHTTIFGVLDPSQTCFVLAYLERDTHNFILQTSVSSTRPSVRFKSTVFKEGRWYHVAFVHRRPKPLSTSKAALYVNGEFAEQVKIAYPAVPPPVSRNASTESFTSFTSGGNAKLSPVQAFVGTPHDLATRLGQGLVFSKWSLATAHLFEDALSDEFLLCHYRLGPRYNGNFQDCLGAFQTYEASAALSLRHEIMHPGKDESSDIITAVKSKASTLLHESRILISILPTAVLSDDAPEENDASQLVRGLSKAAANNFYQLGRQSGGLVAINAAIPSINLALVRTNGTCTMGGDPVVIVPQTIDNAMWRLGGCTSIGLKLVNSATTREEIVRAVEILFESIRGNWRNSDAMERESGYPVLGLLLRGKLSGGTVMTTKSSITPVNPLDHIEREKLSFELLSLVLGFVGYDHAKPENSTIVNPLAYRILLMDNDMWRKAAPITQSLYYKQFTVFNVKSKNHHFNARRLNRMRIVKRFLEALKSELFLAEIFPEFLEALLTLVKGSLNAEIFRTLSLFITYALHKPTPTVSRSPLPRKGTISSRTSVSSITTRKPTVSTNLETKSISGEFVLKRDMAIGVLEMYTDLLCEPGTSVLKKFAAYVTNKVRRSHKLPIEETNKHVEWLLHLLTEDDPQVVVLGTKILARLLVVHGSVYVSKFMDKNGGFVIMQHRLKRWWNEPALWTICFCILFNRDVGTVDFERNFEMFSLLETFQESKIVNPQILPVITAMLSEGLKSLLASQDDPDSPLRDYSTPSDSLALPATPGRSRSMSLNKDLQTRQYPQPKKERLSGQATVLHTVIRFLTELQSKSQNFKDFAMTSEYVRQLLLVLYPAIVNSDSASAEAELNSRSSALITEGGDVIVRPISRLSPQPDPVVRTSAVESQLGGPHPHLRSQIRRGSSFILLSRPFESPQLSETPSSSTAKLVGLTLPKKKVAAQQFSHAVVEEVLELVVNVFIDQVLMRKDFPGFGLFLKVPSGFQEHQVYFESYILRNTISHLGATIKFAQKLLWETRVIQNMAKFCIYMSEAIYEGWFLGGAEPLLDFAGDLLDYLQREDIAKIKSVRLCSHAITSIRNTFLKVALLRLSEIDGPDIPEVEAVAFMNKLHYWQTVVLSADINQQDEYLQLICYQLYTKLVDPRESIQLAAINLWRILLVQKPEETSMILALSIDRKHLVSGFKRLMELDNETFIEWVTEHREEMDALFFGAMSRSWDHFVADENTKTMDTAKIRVGKRREKLKVWRAEERSIDDITLRHDVSSSLWKKNIYDSEHLRHLRVVQDQQDTLSFTIATFAKMDRNLHRSCAVFDDFSTHRWQLDRTEGRNRMRLRMLPDHTDSQQNYQPKRKVTDAGTSRPITLLTNVSSGGSNDVLVTPVATGNHALSAFDGGDDRSGTDATRDEEATNNQEDYELVDDPNSNNDDGYEDKNRKVMRSLKSGDQVQQVFNISRIIGLESCEGLLIVGKHYLYLIDNIFQRSDGEIVSVSQAPADERDPYLQMISGHRANDKQSEQAREQVARNWKWNDVLSMSKRKFLFRDVAIEMFFTDGRSYLLTAISLPIRDDLFSRMASKTPHTSGSSPLPNPEDAWRLEAITVSEETPSGFSSKFGSIFNSSAWNPAMRRWAKGEISNFHYLMLVNTMAGRTFNDLTQYPIFPWILADYTSEELDLDNPATFRDLTKPMGCQNASRQAEFVERYKSFAEMSDQPPFHYGTHYSSAMIVTSYLIRLQPFVQSYLLLQGGSFDHTDRLFYSIENAWNSASKDNMTDVRELIPEFFYLPEFLTNNNGYNFGLRQGNGGSIDNVTLPLWAKGDPKIFIAKQREALESPYVSRHLHEWIDLIFGSKQRGDAALDNVNVFHHLSYSGAKDLDMIDDPHERLATIGIIHNFGQTPHQVFSRSHQAREDLRHKLKRLDTAAELLTKLPFPLLETQETVAHLMYSSKLDRLLCTTAFRLNIPPTYDKYMEWGFADNSVRFFSIDHKKQIGLQENLHQGQLSCAAFADSRTLITAGIDCVISIWSLDPTHKFNIDLVPKTSLFGHKQPVTELAISRSFSTILSASSDGQVLLWDLNRLEFVRKLSGSSGRRVECARINDVTGDIMLCRGQKVALYTLNGELILDQNVCENHEDYIYSCAFYEGQGNEWLENCLIFTGHRRGVVCVWKKVVRDGQWVLELVKRLDLGSGKDAVGIAGSSALVGGSPITCLLPMATVLYTGDDDGKVYEWDLVRHER